MIIGIYQIDCEHFQNKRRNIMDTDIVFRLQRCKKCASELYIDCVDDGDMCTQLMYDRIVCNKKQTQWHCDTCVL